MAESADVRIKWGSGRETELLGVGANQFLKIKEQAPTIAGDSDGDGDVDPADFSTLAANWLQEVAGGPAAGDFNNDGVVGPVDFSMLAGNWLTGVNAATLQQSSASAEPIAHSSSSLTPYALLSEDQSDPRAASRATSGVFEDSPTNFFAHDDLVLQLATSQASASRQAMHSSSATQSTALQDPLDPADEMDAAFTDLGAAWDDLG